MVTDEIVGHALGRIAAGLAVTAGAVDAADLGEEQTQVVVKLGGRAHGGARGAHRVLLLQRDGGADVLDPVDVGPIETLEKHARVGGERLDVPPLPLSEDGVKGEGGLARARDARDDGDAVVGAGQGDVLQVVLPGSLDPEPEGLRHSVRPPEMESLPDLASTRQPDAPDGTGAICFARSTQPSPRGRAAQLELPRCERAGNQSWGPPCGSRWARSSLSPASSRPATPTRRRASSRPC